MHRTENTIVPQRGYFYVMLAALLWAASGTASKYLFNAGITPEQLVQLRLTISSAAIFIAMLLFRPRLLRIAPRDVPYFVALGIMGTAAVQYAYFYAISKIDVAAAILLQDLAPIFITLHSFFFLKERVKLETVGAITVAALGSYLVVGGYTLSLSDLNIPGVTAGLCSAVTFAIYSVAGEYGMRKYNPVTVLFYAMVFGALTWNIVHPPLDGFTRPESAVQWGWVLFIGIPGTVIPYGLFLRGVSLIRSARACITSTLEPITAGIVAFFFLGEAMNIPQMVGALLVICAVVFLQLRQEPDENAPEMIRARTLERKATTG